MSSIIIHSVRTGQLPFDECAIGEDGRSLPPLSDAAVQLLRRMMAWEPWQRPNAAEVLGDSWMAMSASGASYPYWTPVEASAVERFGHLAIG
jgi:hypothetical protein